MSKQYTVRCKGLDSEGAGLVTFNNSIFSVPYVLPGEKCDIELVYGKNETGARLVRVIEPSKDRVEVTCNAYGKCGACNLLHMDYQAECRYKQELVADLFKETGAEQLPFIASDRPDNYRNKIYITFDYQKNAKGQVRYVAGLYQENTRRVVQTNGCLLEKKIAQKITATIIDLMRLTGTRAYDQETGTGTLRHAYFRVSEKTGSVMLVLVTGSKDFKASGRFVETLTKKHGCIETIIWNVNSKKTGMVLGDKDTVLYGKGFIEDELLGLKFRISPHSFYQVNPHQTEKLYRAALEMAEIGKNDEVVDAYCGTGTISLAAAGSAGHVTGVEVNHDAVRDAKEAARTNGIQNVDFVTEDAGKYLESAEKHIDVLIMDPPRSGSDETFLKAAAAAECDRIVYISCEPKTQKRDVEFLMKNGYKCVKMQAVDMFSHTPKVENICLLKRQH